MSPPAAVGAVFVAAGATAATAATVTAVVTAAYIGAAIGAVIGAATSLVTGGNILEGALKGAVIGAITRGAGAAFGAAGSAGSAVGGVGEAGTGVMTAGEAGVSTAGTMTSEGVTFSLGEGLGAATDVGSNVGSGVGGGITGGGGGGGGEGVLSKMAGWIEKNPQQAAIASQAIGGAAKGIAENRGRQKELDALMERDRLALDARRIGGLSDIQTRPTLPKIEGFLDRPKWQMDTAGLLPVRTYEDDENK